MLDHFQPLILTYNEEVDINKYLETDISSSCLVQKLDNVDLLYAIERLRRRLLYDYKCERFTSDDIYFFHKLKYNVTYILFFDYITYVIDFFIRRNDVHKIKIDYYDFEIALVYTCMMCRHIFSLLRK